MKLVHRLNWTHKISTILVLLASSVWFYWLGLNRLVARDEGFYAYAIKLVAEGKLPYLDFFYPQMPLLPYLYAPFLLMIGESWDGLRVVTALFNTVTAGLLFSLILKRTNLFFGVLAVLLFATSNFIFPWFTTVQSYSLSSCLLFLSFFILSDGFQRLSNGQRLLFAGLALGLAVNVRLYLVVLLPLYILALYLESRRLNRIQLLFFLGFLLPFIPQIYLLLIDSSAYLYNNFLYHQTRSGISFFEGLEHKEKILSILVGLESTQKYDGIGFSLLFYIWCASSWLCFRRVSGVPLAWFIAGTLFLVSFLPTPNYVQYFCMLIPFYIVVASVALHHLFVKSSSFTAYLFSSLFLASLVFFYLRDLPGDLHRYTVSGEGVIGIGNKKVAESWNIRRIQEISEEINLITSPDEIVHVTWPGYLLESHAASASGLENHFSMRAGDLLDKEKRERYHLLSHQDLIDSIKTQEINLLVSWSRMLPRTHRNALKESGYKRFHSVGDIWFYRRGE